MGSGSMVVEWWMMVREKKYEELGIFTEREALGQHTCNMTAVE
jgi:hypothetical protein